MKNVGDVPLVPDRVASSEARNDRGFRLLVLGEDGRPSHFGKVRPATDEGARREATVFRALSESRVHGGLVPSTRVKIYESTSIQISEFILGTRLDQLLGKAGPSRVARWLSELLGRVAELLEKLEDEVGPPSERIDVRDSLSGSLRELRDTCLSSRESAVLDTVLRDCPRLPRRLQHGDLWPQNILRGEGGWCLLDFELCGARTAPLYDVCHLLWTSLMRIRSTRASSVYRRCRSVVRAGSYRASLRDVLVKRAVSADLSREQVDASILYYAVHSAAEAMVRSRKSYASGKKAKEQRRLVRTIVNDLQNGTSPVDSFFRA